MDSSLTRGCGRVRFFIAGIESELMAGGHWLWYEAKEQVAVLDDAFGA